MTLPEKTLCVIIALIFACVIVIVVAGTFDPVSQNCRRACAHCEGDAWWQCVGMCEE